MQAQKFRRWYRDAVLRLFDDVDVILAPATPCVAPLIGQKTFVLDGQGTAAAAEYRPVHPADLVHRPAGGARCRCATGASGLPIGVQVIAAPWREDVALRVARALEAAGVVRAPEAPPQA